MNIEGLETRVKYGVTTYWKDDVLIGKKCKRCGESKEVSEFNFQDKKKGTYRPECKECVKQYREATKEHRKQYREANKEHIKEQKKQYREKNKE